MILVIVIRSNSSSNRNDNNNDNNNVDNSSSNHSNNNICYIKFALPPLSLSLESLLS